MTQSPGNNAPQVIIVEDDDDLRESIIEYLKLSGIAVAGVGTALEFYQAIAIKKYAIAILDLALPDQDGLVLSRYVRANTTMRILMLTARTSVEERLAGYESGADFYLLKPVDFRELAATIKNLLQRIPAMEAEASRDNPEKWLLVQKEWALVTPDGEALKLTSKEYAFLRCLANNHGHVVSREHLLDTLDYENNESGNRALESLVYRLRKKISPELDAPIKTATGEGYSFSSLLVLS